MTDLSAEQNAMLERLCKKHLLEIGDFDLNGDYVHVPIPAALAMGRELLLAVQARDAKLAAYGGLGVWVAANGMQVREAIAKEIRAQTYSDLFPSTPKEI